jgi:hypothetical protein
VPFIRQGTGWKVAYAALFLISNESSYVNADTRFLDGAASVASCAPNPRYPNSSRHCEGDRNTHLHFTIHFSGTPT